MTRYTINVIENGENELLFLQRSPHAKLGPNLWGFCGGHIEASESPEECSLREITEELGAEHRIELLAKLGPVRDSFYGGGMEIYLFHYRWHSGHIVLNEEHTRYAWIGRENYRAYSVMRGIDEDIAYFNVWPRSCLNQDGLPPTGR